MTDTLTLPSVAAREYVSTYIGEYSIDEGKGIFSWIHQGDRVAWEVTLRAFDPGGVVVVVSTCPFKIEIPERALVNKFVSLLNFQSTEAVFALQPELGDLTTKTSAFLGSEFLATQIALQDAVGLVRYAVDVNLESAEEVFGAAARLTQGMSTVDAELQALEGL